MGHELVPAEELLDRAVTVAEQTPEDCLEQYAFTRRACQAAALRRGKSHSGQTGGKLPPCAAAVLGTKCRPIGSAATNGG
jgi:enoyl-CoA hydratase